MTPARTRRRRRDVTASPDPPPAAGGSSVALPAPAAHLRLVLLAALTGLPAAVLASAAWLATAAWQCRWAAGHANA